MKFFGQLESGFCASRPGSTLGLWLCFFEPEFPSLSNGDNTVTVLEMHGDEVCPAPCLAQSRFLKRASLGLATSWSQE